MTVYCSDQTHSATEKDAKIAGIGKKNVRKIAVDERFAMRADALEAAIVEDTRAGATPICVVASLGATGVGAMDPIRHGVWLHVTTLAGRHVARRLHFDQRIGFHQRVMAQAGSTARLPMLWLYSENDQNYGPDKP